MSWMPFPFNLTGLCAWQTVGLALLGPWVLV